MAGKIHNGPNGPGPCGSKPGGRGCPFDPEGTGENHFETQEEAQAAYDSKMESEHGLVTTASKVPAKRAAEKKKWVPNPAEQALRDRNAELARKIVDLRAEHGDVTFEDANPERSRRRLSEAIGYAEERSNVNLVGKLTSAKVLPSGAFKRKEDGKRVNTDAVIKDYVAEKHIENGRAQIEKSIRDKITAGVIKEGKYTHKDDSGTYSMTIQPGFDSSAFEALDEKTKDSISSTKPGLSKDLAKEKLSAEDFEKISSKSQVMDFSIGKAPDVGQDKLKPNLEITGDTSEAAAGSALTNLSNFTQAAEAQYGSKKDRAARKSENAEIIKSAVADKGQNTFSPGRAYGNGVLISARTSVNPKAAEEHLTPQQIKSITTKTSSVDPVKAKKVLSPEQYSAIFEAPTASLRVTPKRAPK